MIRGSRLVLVLCAATALALHAAGLWVSGPRAEIEIEGGDGAVEAALGSSFADMVAGAAQPVEETSVTMSTRVKAEARPTKPDVAPRPEPPQTAPATRTVTTARTREAAQEAQAASSGEAMPADIAEVAADAAHPAIAPQVKPSREILRALAVAPTAPVRLETVAEAAGKSIQAPTETTPKPSRPVAPDSVAEPERAIPRARAASTAESARAVPAPPPPEAQRTPVAQTATHPSGETVAAEPEKEDGLQVSQRPRARPRALEVAAAAQSVREPERRVPSRGASGSNATRDASRGSAAGRETSSAARQGQQTASRSTEQGNAAASNYPGLVMRHLARVPRPRAQARGAALVQFSIGSTGQLASVGLARSSGSSQLDRAALAVVQRAAPFPPPPSGAQRRFSIRIEGR